MAKKGYLYICNRCGEIIDTENEIDCVETMMFRQRNIGERVADDDSGREFHEVDGGGRLHFCGKCNQMLMSHYVFGREYKNCGGACSLRGLRSSAHERLPFVLY